MRVRVRERVRVRARCEGDGKGVDVDVERRPVQPALLHAALHLGAAAAAALVETHRALRVAVDVDEARLGRYGGDIGEI